LWERKRNDPRGAKMDIRLRGIRHDSQRLFEKGGRRQEKVFLSNPFDYLLVEKANFSSKKYIVKTVDRGGVRRNHLFLVPIVKSRPE